MSAKCEDPKLNNKNNKRGRGLFSASLYNYPSSIDLFKVSLKIMWKKFANNLKTIWN